jgi:hypothetical protein
VFDIEDQKEDNVLLLRKTMVIEDSHLRPQYCCFSHLVSSVGQPVRYENNSFYNLSFNL